jgi:predicted Zn-dependent protease
MMTLKDARNHYKKANSTTNKPSQIKFHYLMKPSAYVSIKIFSETDVPLDWKTALDQAIASWNNINTGINLIRVTNKTEANIFATMFYEANSTKIAEAYLPDNQ